MRKKRTIIPKEVKIGACADYLLGKPVAQIAYKWGVPGNYVTRWIKDAGSFKLRYPGRGGRKSKNG